MRTERQSVPGAFLCPKEERAQGESGVSFFDGSGKRSLKGVEKHDRINTAKLMDMAHRPVFQAKIIPNFCCPANRAGSLRKAANNGLRGNHEY